jgi:hypothetical protein
METREVRVLSGARTLPFSLQVADNQPFSRFVVLWHGLRFRSVRQFKIKMDGVTGNMGIPPGLEERVLRPSDFPGSTCLFCPYSIGSEP